MLSRGFLFIWVLHRGDQEHGGVAWAQGLLLRGSGLDHESLALVLSLQD